MAADPNAYAWLADTSLEVAGCVTVVADAPLEAVARAFGCDPEPETPVTFGTTAGDSDGALQGLQAWVGRAGDAAVVVEENDFQGSRSEVIRPASKASVTGLAASVFWNVEGLVMFTAARRGKVVCSAELMEVELEELPRALRRLAARADDEDEDAVAVGAAMVEQFTGVPFDCASLDGAVHRTLTPVPDDLVGEGLEHTRLRYVAPTLVDAIAAADPGRWRPLAAWAARAAAAEAGVTGEAAVRELVDALDGTERGVTFVDTDTGRHLDRIQPERVRSGVFSEAVLAAVAATDPNWSELAARLPTPFTPEQREELVRVDQQLQEEGAFATWQFERSRPVGDDWGDSEDAGD